jgi:UDP-GlcNAc:undecaprenyl-phosphate GlcNAc-1-phosphate transferase
LRLQAHLWFAVVLALLSAAIVRAMIRIGALDHPGVRSSHTHPTPKGGGVGIVATFVLGLLVLFAGAGQARVPDAPFLGLIGAAIGIAAVSYTDDLRDWPFAVKLAAQLAAALVAIACGIRFGTLHLPWLGAWRTGWLGAPLTAAWILFATNAVNFIDGLNGLASGSVAIACLFLAAIGYAQGDWFVHVAALALAAGIAGFLPFNYPRARIFMGDVGSQFCGFVLAVLGVLASGFGAQTLSVLLVPMLLMGVWFDVAFTLVRRWWAGDRLTEAHRSHLYQVAQRAGMPAWAVTLVQWGMAAWGGLCCLGFAIVGGPWKPAVPFAVLLPQFAWLGYVTARAGRAGITRW